MVCNLLDLLSKGKHFTPVFGGNTYRQVEGNPVVKRDEKLVSPQSDEIIANINATVKSCGVTLTEDQEKSFVYSIPDVADLTQHDIFLVNPTNEINANYYKAFCQAWTKYGVRLPHSFLLVQPQETTSTIVVLGKAGTGSELQLEKFKLDEEEFKKIPDVKPTQQQANQFERHFLVPHEISIIKTACSSMFPVSKVCVDAKLFNFFSDEALCRLLTWAKTQQEEIEQHAQAFGPSSMFGTKLNPYTPLIADITKFIFDKTKVDQFCKMILKQAGYTLNPQNPPLLTTMKNGAQAITFDTSRDQAEKGGLKEFLKKELGMGEDSVWENVRGKFALRIKLDLSVFQSAIDKLESLKQERPHNPTS